MFRVHLNPENRTFAAAVGMSAMGHKRTWSLSSLLQIQPAHRTPSPPAQTSNGTSSLDPAGNANYFFCILFRCKKLCRILVLRVLVTPTPVPACV